MKNKIKTNDIILSSIACFGLLFIILACCVNFWSLQISAEYMGITESISGSGSLFSEATITFQGVSLGAQQGLKIFGVYWQGWAIVLAQVGVITALVAGLVYVLFLFLQATGVLNKSSIVLRKILASVVLIGTVIALTAIIVVSIKHKGTMDIWTELGYIPTTLSMFGNTGAGFIVMGGLIFGVFGLISACIAGAKKVEQPANEIAEEVQTAETQSIVSDIPSTLKKIETPSLNISTDVDSITYSLKKYKELLDEGIITQEDYDAKKKRLLK